MRVILICNRIIEFSFYLLFFLTPLVFTSDNYELFEFPKMWLVFALTLIIAASWAIKMTLQGRIFIQRTPFDIPIALFLLSQIISTIFSLDIHVSMWGYYSRFNGGLFSILAYIFLYYALVSNFSDKEARGDTTGRKREAGLSAEALAEAEPRAVTMVKRLLLVSLVSGLVVALWGLPSHFGYDPTCFLLRGSFDVSCWTEAFQPKIRIFSTLGQPNWLAAYLSILIPIAIASAIQKTQIAQTVGNIRESEKSEFLKLRLSDFLALRVFRVFWKTIFFLLFAILFFVDLLFTKSQSGFVGLMIALFFFIGFVFYSELKAKKSLKEILLKSHTAGILLIILVVFGLIFFFAGSPIERLNILTYEGIKNAAAPKIVEKAVKQTTQQFGELGGTDSFKIRMIVWRGALEIFKNNPLFGTGVETFAFAYYKYRPVEHNLTSEWDYLYNKAHNEYLNYLATTGAFGLGTYLVMVGAFLFLILTKYTNAFANFAKPPFASFVNNFAMIREKGIAKSNPNSFLVLALLSSYISILISNFFGFSVVVVNLYFFLIPAFVFILGGMINSEKTITIPLPNLPAVKFFKLELPIVVVLLIVNCYLLLVLFRFFLADKAYALGYNLNRSGQYQLAYPKLLEAVTLRSGEPAFMDELSLNNAILSAALSYEKESTLAAQLKKTALKTSEAVLAKHPNNVVFWKTRVRALYALSQAEPEHLPLALSAIQNAKRLAPTDAKVSYNLGLLYGQNGEREKAIETLEQTIKLKPNYYDAYYALGLFYHEKAIDKNGKVINSALQKKAVEAMKYILDNFATDDAQAIKALETWGEQ